jgi:putative phosphoribosyl transferase
MDGAFLNRTEAGRILAPKLRAFAHRDDVIVLALPRGGVAVGLEVARRLHAPMDVLVVRKLGVPGQEELAMGAVASGGIEFRDAMIIDGLRVPAADVDAVATHERAKLNRREVLYRGRRPEPALAGRTVILVDDGIATGATMHAAVRAVRTRHPQAIVVAAPIASAEAVDALRKEATAVITVLTSSRLISIGEYYRDFKPMTDQEVQCALAHYWGNRALERSSAA